MKLDLLKPWLTSLFQPIFLLQAVWLTKSSDTATIVTWSSSQHTLLKPSPTPLAFSHVTNENLVTTSSMTTRYSTYSKAKNTDSSGRISRKLSSDGPVGPVEEKSSFHTTPTPRLAGEGSTTGLKTYLTAKISLPTLTAQHKRSSRIFEDTVGSVEAAYGHNTQMKGAVSSYTTTTSNPATYSSESNSKNVYTNKIPRNTTTPSNMGTELSRAFAITSKSFSSIPLATKNINEMFIESSLRQVGNSLETKRSSVTTSLYSSTADKSSSLTDKASAAPQTDNASSEAPKYFTTSILTYLGRTSIWPSNLIGQDITPTSVISQQYVSSSSVTEASKKRDSSFECNFERDLCGWEQSKDDYFDWLLKSGPTEIDGTGPEYDPYFNPGRYLLILSYSQHSGKSARLAYRNFTGAKCFRFYYHMRGSAIGQLNIYINGSLVFNKVGHQSHGWVQGGVFLNGSHSEVIVEGVTGYSLFSFGLTVIDEFTLTESCETHGSSNGSLECTFDEDLCGWTQSIKDDFDWSAYSSKAPLYDHTSGKGTFLFTQTSWPQKAGDKALLVYSNFTGSKCFTFYYKMYSYYSYDVSTLNVYVDDVIVFTTSDHQGYTWWSAQFMLNGSKSEIVFESVKVSGDHGNLINLDDFILTDRCNASRLLPVNGSWNAWSEWSECSRIPSWPPCGTGARLRNRTCNWPINGGYFCTGRETEEKLCNLTVACPDHLDGSMSCSFDHSFCGWEQSQRDELDWLVAERKDSSDKYGPYKDHTSGKGFYLFLASEDGYETQKARFVYSQNFTGLICLTFYYYMVGSSPGNLWLSVDGIGLFQNSEGQGKQWKKVQVQLQLNNSLVVIGAYPGDGTIALDDFNVTEDCNDKSAEAIQGKWSQWGPVQECLAGEPAAEYQPSCGNVGRGYRLRTCTNPPPSNGGSRCLGLTFMYDSCQLPLCPGGLTFNCNFDEGYCGWTQSKSDEFDWSWTNTSTPSTNTGPEHDQTTTFGHFIFIDAYSAKMGDKAQMKYTGLSGTKLLSFWYHMYGDEIGELNVYVDGFKVHTIAGDQGNVWWRDDVLATTNNSEVIFEAVVGAGVRGDIALDDIFVADILQPSLGESNATADVSPASYQTAKTSTSRTPSGQSEEPTPENPLSSTSIKKGLSLITLLTSFLGTAEMQQCI